MAALNRQNMNETAQLESLQSNRIPGSGGSYQSIWVARAPVRCRFNPNLGDARAPAAGQLAPSGTWLLAFAAYSDVAVGERAVIRGGPARARWQRLVVITSVVPMSEQAMLVAGADDVPLDG